jgi:putative phosphoribosyl transferase
MFEDRKEAGKRLAEALQGRLPDDALVLAVPRGGVVVAAEVARALSLELDLVVVRKIGAPGNPEYAIGAVDEDGNVIAGRWGADSGDMRQAAEAERGEIARRLAAYRGDRPRPRIAGRTVVVVDDGIATGMTLLAAVESLRRRGAARIVVAAPVAAPSAAHDIARSADEAVILETPPGFYAVGQFYRFFDQTSDAEVVALLEEAWARMNDRPD